MVDAAAVDPFTAAAHVLVADVDVPVLDDEAHHHLTRVLRLRPGSAVTVTDGAGRWRPCALAGATPGDGVEPAGEVRRTSRPEPALTVGVGLAKGAKPDDAVRRLTEIGIDRIAPFVADRSVVQWDDATAARRIDRLRLIARSALEQSRRCWLPVVAPVVPFASLVAAEDAGCVALADAGGDPPTLTRTTVLVGPEGGWSDAERAAVPTRVAVGDAVLRAETAAVVVGGVLAALRAGLLPGGTR